MQKANYSDFANHQKAHKELVKQVIELQAKFKAGNGFVTMDVLNFLKNWLIIHIEERIKSTAKLFD